MELTFGFQTSIWDNAVRKSNHYKDLCNQLKIHYNYVRLINLSIGAIDIIGESRRCFYDLLMNYLKPDETHKNFIVIKMISYCIRKRYYLLLIIIIII